jgi:hypothetical protein
MATVEVFILLPVNIPAALVLVFLGITTKRTTEIIKVVVLFGKLLKLRGDSQ